MKLKELNASDGILQQSIVLGNVLASSGQNHVVRK